MTQSFNEPNFLFHTSWLFGRKAIGVLDPLCSEEDKDGIPKEK